MKHSPGQPYLKSSEADETSGVVASIAHKGILYIHNDSGDISRFFAIDTTGTLLSTCFYSDSKSGETLDVKDCEDIAIGPGPVASQSYIYIGDIGDNKGVRPFITIYRVPEPKQLTTFVHTTGTPINLVYPDGPRDAETLMIDPILRQIYIISKREDSVGIYSALLPGENTTHTIHLQKKTSIKFEGQPNYKWITGGDISHAGNQILIRSYNKVYYWPRFAHEPVESAIVRPPDVINCVQEPQGEAICFNADDTGLFCISEGKNANVNFANISHRAQKKKAEEKVSFVP